MNEDELNEDCTSILVKLFNKFEKDGFLGVKKYFILFISIILFLSPITIFNMTYGKGLFEGSSEVEKIVYNLIVNTLIFIILYIIGSVRKIKNVKDVIAFNTCMTLFLMGVITLVISVSYNIYEFFKESAQFKLGILLLVLTVLIIIAYYTVKWVRLIRELIYKMDKYIKLKDDENQKGKIEKMKPM